jgi:tRNA 2-thiocytidine biosynthesis protein TtcA
MGNIVPSHLMDRKLYAFQTLRTRGVADPGGDHAFDQDAVAGCGSPGLPQLPIAKTLHPVSDWEASSCAP